MNGAECNKKLLSLLKREPKVYEPGTAAAFWNDDHISRHMLEAHLDPSTDAASRKPEFVRASADWIARYCDPQKRPCLLDLGCGPGLYSRRFAQAGFRVTGIDISRRSIAYAQGQADKAGLKIAYECRDYLTLAASNAFDTITLIYCDFGVLSPEKRHALLKKAFCALRQDGILILDAFAPKYAAAFPVGQSFEYQDSGFWSAQPYLCLRRNRYYAETANTLEQYIVVTQNGCECHNIWNQIFTADSLRAELAQAGFSGVQFFDDAAGREFSGNADTICVAAAKR